MASSLPMKHHKDSNSLLNKTFSRFLKTRGVYWGVSIHSPIFYRQSCTILLDRSLWLMTSTLFIESV
jgi:hypothetical protein